MSKGNQRRNAGRCNVCEGTCVKCLNNQKMKDFANSLTQEKVENFKEMFQMFDKVRDAFKLDKMCGISTISPPPLPNRGKFHTFFLF